MQISRDRYLGILNIIGNVTFQLKIISILHFSSLSAFEVKCLFNILVHHVVSRLLVLITQTKCVFMDIFFRIQLCSYFDDAPTKGNMVCEGDNDSKIILFQVVYLLNVCREF